MNEAIDHIKSKIPRKDEPLVIEVWRWRSIDKCSSDYDFSAEFPKPLTKGAKDAGPKKATAKNDPMDLCESEGSDESSKDDSSDDNSDDDMDVEPPNPKTDDRKSSSDKSSKGDTSDDSSDDEVDDPRVLKTRNKKYARTSSPNNDEASNNVSTTAPHSA